jgi:hypothetical protein
VVYLVRTPIGYVLLGGFVAVAASGPVNLLSRKLPRGLAIAIVYLGNHLHPDHHRADPRAPRRRAGRQTWPTSCPAMSRI